MRQIIEIDEEKCNGCGQCILACAEGALALVEGKARLVGEIYCDGLGACIGECPTGALTITEREAEDFDEQAVQERAAQLKREEAKARQVQPPPPRGCPSARAMVLERKEAAAHGQVGEITSELRHWPIKLKLLRPGAPFLQGADLLLLADCAGVSYPDLHRKLLRGRAVVIGCPKFDDLDEHIEALADIIAQSRPASLSVAYMEVPCCYGFVYAAQKALEKSGADLPLKALMIGRSGEVLEEQDLIPGSQASASV